MKKHRIFELQGIDLIVMFSNLVGKLLFIHINEQEKERLYLINRTITTQRDRVGTCWRVVEWEFNWRARAALEAREWAWRCGRLWEMSWGGNLCRRSWIQRRRELAF